MVGEHLCGAPAWEKEAGGAQGPSPTKAGSRDTDLCVAGSWTNPRRKAHRRGYLCIYPDPADKARHDRMVALVERMLESNKQKHA